MIRYYFVFFIFCRMSCTIKKENAIKYIPKTFFFLFLANKLFISMSGDFFRLSDNYKGTKLILVEVFI